MGQARKYATLPDLDEAPDIYETPELTDDASTLQTSTTARSPSPTASEASENGISRHRLQPDRARTQFGSSRVDARDADFSDRVSSKRRAYHVSSRKSRGVVVENGEHEEEDWDSQDEEEGLQRRLARLMREVQEVQAEVERRKVEGAQKSEGAGTAEGQEKDEDDVSAKVKDLGIALDTLQNSQRDAGSAHAQLAKQLAKPTRSRMAEPESTNGIGKGFVDTNAANSQTLTKIADFDSRLALLERALGTSSIDMPEAIPGNGSANFTPILPTLALLDKQLSLLTASPSQPHLDNLVQKLQEAQSKPLDSQTAQQAAAGRQDDVTTSDLTREDMAKLRSLYALLPTLTSLTPTLPPLLTRLRSLRTLHASAATANESLEEVERRQDEADKEIREWKEGLQKVEDVVKDAEKGMGENAGVVEAWVKDLEDRLQKLD